MSNLDHVRLVYVIRKKVFLRKVFSEHFTKKLCQGNRLVNEKAASHTYLVTPILAIYSKAK